MHKSVGRAGDGDNDSKIAFQDIRPDVTPEDPARAGGPALRQAESVERVGAYTWPPRSLQFSNLKSIFNFSYELFFD
jgi:hypothetical protein